MQFSTRITTSIIRVIQALIMLSIFAYPSISSSRSCESLIICGTSKHPQDGNFEKNLNKLIYDLRGKARRKSFGVSSPANLYGLVQCHRDLSSSDCQNCFHMVEDKVSRCSPFDSARVYLDGCFFRYDDYNFFNESLDPLHDNVKCSQPIAIFSDELLHKQFQAKLGVVLLNVTDQAKKNKGFGAVEAKGGVLTVYALAQCWETLSPEGCSQCFDRAKAELKNCSHGADGKAMLAGCYLRYSTDRFFSTGAEDPIRAKRVKTVTTEIILVVVGFTVLSSFGAFLGYKRLAKRLAGKNNLASSANMSSLNFKYEMLEKATDNFDGSRKLGQGGAGSVFKGTLPDGRNVAVKRLFFNTRQWVDQFFNEVNLISGIQHKNLVRLLGCSIEGPESLLVYEYVPNRSLDQILFVKDTIHILSWQQRFTIICGTAEGLAYLHGGSGTKIIHRDIKTSNILLDEKLTPKIADFGLARCASPDRSHVSTGIAGTLGYMAPEYLVKGQLTQKADVYAFGVLVIEVASGRKNSVFSEGSSSILHNVWKHYRANKITQSMDPGLSGRFPENEASKVLQIGLLCTQASVALRPSMSEVVQMLNDKDFRIPSPKQPPFLNASVISPGDSSKNSFLNTSGLEEQKILVKVPSSYRHNSFVTHCLDSPTIRETKPS
ncbi:hypothetical protein JRO89_XSUnG0178600 [Xanthoceras sorbifolium]|uniref:Cysteine-rich receptor-like protein kinase 1 n=1 Tax=Xanthoceras sorbifolium TaxID=99658 RepID=A0ABQ8GXJ3_9ROSI|nr:hypothetical protein JRO89_XSUnG0178600 [Xanthoceras sorbifolium]